MIKLISIYFNTKIIQTRNTTTLTIIIKMSKNQSNKTKWILYIWKNNKLNFAKIKSKNNYLLEKIYFELN